MGDVGGRIHEHDVDGLAVRRRLFRDQLCPEQRLGRCLDVIDAFRELYAAGFAATARVDLGLDEPGITAERAGVCRCFVRRGGGLARQYRDAVVLEQRLRLIFMEIHCFT